MQEYKEELITRSAGKTSTQYLKVISLPTFNLSHSIVLLDLETLQSYEVGFDISDEIKDKKKVET